jgi:hypothetical protein
VELMLGDRALALMDSLLEKVPTLEQQLAWCARAGISAAGVDGTVPMCGQAIDPLVQPYRASVMGAAGTALSGYKQQMLRELDRSQVLMSQIAMEQDRARVVDFQREFPSAAAPTEPQRRTDWTTADGRYLRASPFPDKLPR